MATKFVPNYAIHPGVVLADDIAIAGLTQAKLSEITGISKTVINEIVKEKRGISVKTALSLEKAFPVYGAEYWLNLQGHYELTLERLRREREKPPLKKAVN